MPHRLTLRCSCGLEFSVPADVPVGSLVPCPRCTHTLRITSVPTAAARPVGGGRHQDHRPQSYAGPRRRLGVPVAPGHVSLRRTDSDVLVNYGLWTLLAGIVSTLTPLAPINSPKWDVFISYQPWAGIVVAVSGILMMIAYQSGPDFARGPGAPVLVAAFWIAGITMAVFAGWIAEHVRKREMAAEYAAATAPTIQQQAPPLPRHDQAANPPSAAPVNPPAQQAAPIEQPNKETAANGVGATPAKSGPPAPGRDPFGIPRDGATKTEKEDAPRTSDANRGLADVKKDLGSEDKRVLLRALDEIQWYFQRSARQEIADKLTGLLSHSDEEVLLATIKALKIWADDDQAAALIPFASHESVTIRNEAIGLLGKFKSPLGMAALVDRLEEDTEAAKAALLRAGKVCEAAVRKGLHSKSKTTRLECVKIAGTLGLRAALREVRNMADYEKDGEIRGEARRVADELAKEPTDKRKKN